jgi:hypothetical protein
VNGSQWPSPVTPGRFYSIDRTWKDGDRVEMNIDMPLRLETVDAQHPKLLAVVQGPLALFAVGDRFLPFTRTELMTARQSSGTAEWRIATRDGDQLFKPYFAIGAERTRLYHPISV